jgi:hypothetical protein
LFKGSLSLTEPGGNGIFTLTSLRRGEDLAKADLSLSPREQALGRLSAIWFPF